jgi:hypothetical protein
VALLDHLLDATSPETDQRKLGGDEERIQKNEYPDRRQSYRDVYDARGSLRAGRRPSYSTQQCCEPGWLDLNSVPQFERREPGQRNTIASCGTACVVRLDTTVAMGRRALR